MATIGNARKIKASTVPTAGMVLASDEMAVVDYIISAGGTYTGSLTAVFPFLITRNFGPGQTIPGTISGTGIIGGSTMSYALQTGYILKNT